MVGTLLVLFIEGRLLHYHLFEQVLLCFVDQDFSEALLMFFDTQPSVVVDLSLGNFTFMLAVHIKNRLVDRAHLRLILSLEVNLWVSVLACIVGINISLSCLIEALKELLIYQVLPLLVIEIYLIILQVFTIAVRFARVFRLPLLRQISVVLVALFELSFLLQIDDLGVVDTDWTSKGLGADHLIYQVHCLGGQLDL